MKRVIVNGAHGRLGKIIVETLTQAEDFDVVATLGREDSLDDTIQHTNATIVVDATCANAVKENTQIIIQNNAHPVIGTSGLSAEEILFFQEECRSMSLGGLIAPNFALGAILMMRFAEQAARVFQHAEIIEMHHENKKDAPSGTAIKTADLIGNTRQNLPVACEEKLSGALGANHQTIPIHSLRLPGILARQQVIFGAPGETLTIQHDSLNHHCFAAGILLACRQVSKLTELVYGLEHLLP